MWRAGVSAAVVLVLSTGKAGTVAGDGILITHTITSGRETATHRALIERTRIRSELIDQGGNSQTVVFDRSAQILRIVDGQAKTYSELRTADADRVGGHMAAALADLQRELKTAPPGERPKFEAMIAALADPPIEYAKAGADRVGRWACDKYVATRKSEKVGEVCIAEPATLGFTVDDLAILKPFVEFYSKVTKGGAALLFNVGLNPPPASAGIVVRVIGAGGAAQMNTVLIDATRRSFPEALFAIPDGYAKRDFPGLRAR